MHMVGFAQCRLFPDPEDVYDVYEQFRAKVLDR